MKLSQNNIIQFKWSFSILLAVMICYNYIVFLCLHYQFHNIIYCKGATCMGFKEKIQKYYTDSYLKKYGDRMTQFQGNVLSAKVEEKTILWIFHKITAVLIIKPDTSKMVIRCSYKKNRWFKKPAFIQVNQGHKVIVMGLKGEKGKDGKDSISIMNLINLTTKVDLIPIDHSQIKKMKQPTPRMRG